MMRLRALKRWAGASILVLAGVAIGIAWERYAAERAAAREESASTAVQAAERGSDSGTAAALPGRTAPVGAQAATSPTLPASLPSSKAYDFEADPIARALHGKVPPFVKNILQRYERFREYSSADFPLGREEHARFRSRVRRALIESMTGPDGNGDEWVVTDDRGERSVVLDRVEITSMGPVEVKGTKVDLFTMRIADTGDVIPFASCAPERIPAPAVVVFSGHTAEGGLRELFVDEESYQRALARRLCQAGFFALAMEKIDSGLSTMHFQLRGERWQREDEPGGGADDELEAATTLIGIGDYLIPGRQLMANIAAVEIVAADPRVEAGRIGAAGVSLGGWLTLHTALVNSRIKAVANFGGMWSYLEAHENSLEGFEGINDFSQLIPGLWRLGDQNRFVLAAAPLAMLTGYGELDVPYVRFKKYFFPLVSSQYEALGAGSEIEVLVHEAGHTVPVDAVIDFFRRRL